MPTMYRTCPLCEATCGLELTVTEERVTVIRGDRDNVFSGGFICPKGTTLGRIHEDPDRLRSPRIRVGEGRWEDVDWKEAFAFVDERYAAIVDAHGRDSVAVYLGNPNVHSLDNGLAARPFVKALQTRNVYTAATVDQMPKHVSAGYMFGSAGAIPVPDLDRTSHLLILGANPYESNGSLATAPDWPGRLEALRARGGTITVVDPRRTKTADAADIYLAIRPGTDAALLLGMINHVFTAGLVDMGLLEDRVGGLGRLEAAAARFAPETVAAFCGIESDSVRRLAEDLARADSACVYGRIGTHTVEFGTVASWAVDVLNVLTGNLDRAGGAMFAKAAHLPIQSRRRDFVTGRWTSRVGGFPEVIGELPVVTLADEIQTPGDGRVRAMFVIAGNPALTNPDAARLSEALRGLELLVSVDPYLNETSRHADVILPPPSHLERPHYDMAFTALSVRNYAMFSPSVFEAEGPSEFDILVTLTGIVSGLGPDVDPSALAGATLDQQISRAAGAIDVEAAVIRSELERWNDPRLALLDLMLRTGPYGDGFGTDPDGLTLQSLAAESHGLDLGPLEARLDEVLATSSGNIELAPTPIIDDLDRLEAAVGGSLTDSMVLIGRRQVRTANSWLGNIEVLVRGREQCTLQIHPDDASRVGLESGSMATVASETGKIDVPVEVTDSIRPGVVSLPYGWGHDLEGMRLSVASTRPGVNVNILTSTAHFDPLSGNAVLNAIPVTVAPA
jgi:anaerobic selenocysteine-containing dehydrogenase